eukprot:c4869_g1_i1.p1 GENE.c4869_g1_i1~~c4869_g1_i1.p1  ORF type:complete len:610 (-),score=218.48 c4869_g1_i1:142-1971(-)
MWLNDKATPLGTCQQNIDLTICPPTIELEFETYPKLSVYSEPINVSPNSSQPSKADKILGSASCEDNDKLNSKAKALLGVSSTPQTEIERLSNQDMLYELTEKDKNTLWQRRHQASSVPLCLSKLLRSVNWTSTQDVCEIKQILMKWPKISVRDAIELLDAKFAEEFVRTYAVSCIENIHDSELEEILPQLIQGIKHEPYHSSALARFLFSRALQSPYRIGHQFFWHLKSESHNVAIRERYGVLLSCYLDGCSQQLREQYKQQTDLIKSLVEVAKMVKSLSKNQRTGALRQFLSTLKFSDNFVLPLSSRMVAKGFLIDKCKCMQSATVPLFLVFENADPHGKPIYLIFKAGDDLRQDILTLQMFQIMDRIWCENKLDLSMTLYKCVALDFEVGFIEVVCDSETVANISRKQGGKVSAALAAFKQNPIGEWINQHNPSPENQQAAKLNFRKSCAAYCVATYVLGIGDRHNDNVMITQEGKLFHIDFGHFLGNFQKFLGLNRDRAPFVLTPDFVFVFGGKDSPEFKLFVEDCQRAYNLLRKNYRVFMNLFGLMLSTGISELQTQQDLNFLRLTLSLDDTEEQAATKFEKLIYESLNTKSTQVNNAIHILAN